ncbi:MAG: DUF6279 family lipoprotein [Gammaproteobacteria bacterium]|nr:DUF6279 family lipoprotein [Gammaproteobacteria bacterium]
MHRTSQLLWLMLITAISFSACSFKTVYNNVDYLAAAYIDDYVSLDTPLETELELRLSALHNWHRSTQLRQYTSWLQQLQTAIVKRAGEKEIAHLIEQFESLIDHSLIKLDDELASFLPQLNKLQQQELFAKLKESNDEFYDDYIAVSIQQRTDKYYQRLLDNYETWLDSLTEPQMLLLQEAAENIQSSAELRLLYRIRWQAGIKTILEQTSAPKTRKTRLLKFFVAHKKQKQTEFKKAADHNTATITSTTVKIASSMSPEQLKYFNKTCKRTLRMLTELSESR